MKAINYACNEKFVENSTCYESAKLQLGLKFRDLSHGAWWNTHELMAFKTGEAITLLLLATLAIFGLVGIVSWYSFFSFSAWQWDLLLSCLALVTNGLLCSMQVVVIFRLGELKSDHINHFDMEKIMRRILIPEQSSQACISPPLRFPPSPFNGQSPRIGLVVGIIVTSRISTAIRATA
jgi:hypothetical protein